MQPEDKPKFLATLNGLAAIKPGAKLTAESLTLYWNALSDWSIDDFTAAASQLARTSEFMPNPYHFEQLRKAGRMTAGEAFDRAMTVARNCSRHYQATSGDPRVDAAARACGGYYAMGQQDTERIGFLERRFVEHFESISEAEDIREALPYLTPTPPPKLPGPQS